MVRVGLIAEGRFDLAVLDGVLKGACGISNTQYLRPEFTTDRTDRSAGYQAPSAVEFSNFEIVKQECESRQKIREFFDTGLDDERWLVVQIDTAEAEKYGVERPSVAEKDATYFADLRSRVVEAVRGWMQGEFADKVFFAVAIEETDAWLLACWDEQNKKDAGTHANPKKRLEFVLNEQESKVRARLFPDDMFERGLVQSAPLRKRKTLVAAAGRCASLRAFIESLPAQE
jgi:hypothetical protein